MPRIGCSLRKLCAILGFAVLLAGCNMSGPGVMRVQPMQQPGQEYETTYNSEWVNKKAPDPLGELNGGRELSIDISERELGARYMDEDRLVGTNEVRYQSAAEKRQAERRNARREAWRTRMGIKTVTDEQKERDSE